MHLCKEPIAVIGAGALGCLLGAVLAESGHAVTLVDPKPETIAHIAASGILVETATGRRWVAGLRASSSYSVLRTVGLVLICVKSPATAAVAAAVRDTLSPRAMVLTLQNGLGNLEVLTAHLPVRQVAVGVTAVGASLLGVGHVRQAGIGETVIGCPDGGDASRVAALCALLEDAGLPTRRAASVPGMLWTKLMANVGINALAALTGLRNGDIFALDEAEAIAVAAVEEASRVAAAAGVRLEVEDPVAHVRHVAQVTAANEASMLQDMRAVRPTEIEAINGAVSRHGDQLCVPTPVNDLLASLVRLRQKGSMLAVGQKKLQEK